MTRFFSRTIAWVRCCPATLWRSSKFNNKPDFQVSLQRSAIILQEDTRTVAPSWSICNIFLSRHLIFLGKSSGRFCGFRSLRCSPSCTENASFIYAIYYRTEIGILPQLSMPVCVIMSGFFFFKTLQDVMCKFNTHSWHNPPVRASSNTDPSVGGFIFSFPIYLIIFA